MLDYHQIFESKYRKPEPAHVRDGYESHAGL